MGKPKPASATAAPRGHKRRPKRTRPSGKGGGPEPREEKRKRRELDGVGLAEEAPPPGSSLGKILSTESGAIGLEQSDEDDMEDEHTVPGDDETNDMINNKDDAFDEMDSFHRHVSRIITNEEVNALLKQKCKFKWEVPAEDIPKSKWVGTGEKMEGAYVDLIGGVKGKLRDHWQNTLSDQLNSRLNFFSLCSSYRDIMHCNKKPFYLKGGSTVDSSTMDSYLMHALNHINRTREIVVKNDAKLRSDPSKDILDDNSFLDQGFTRPKVLFLLPLKSIARRVVKRLIQLSPLSQKDIIAKFEGKFGESDDEVEEPVQSNKPADFDLLFAGDTDDEFLFGIKYTKKSMNLFSNFYSSDIIVASPLALIKKINGVDDNGKEPAKERDFDFLSSIESWSHLYAVFEQLNQLPSKEHGTNVMRIRPWYLDQHARYYRQTILLSSYLTPEMNALFNGLCLNYEGKVKLVTEFKGVLSKIQFEAPQVYERFDASSITEVDDARFDHFCKKVYPKIQESDELGISRKEQPLNSKDGSQATNLREDNIATRYITCKTLIRGAHHLIIYSLPGRKEFYPELVNMLSESENKKCTVFFSRLDLLKVRPVIHFV
uniref:UTP25 NTP hydrolase-like domain-containing protein n=1 Tax=Oryza nivara TaxID=4536 RepID=A0A0E0HC28_ORYNI